MTVVIDGVLIDVAESVISCEEGSSVNATLVTGQGVLLSSELHGYLQAATSRNTRAAYQADIQHFRIWGGLLPASPDMILNYLQAHATTLNPRTLRRRLVAIRQWHACQQFADPTSHPLIRKALSGIANVHGKPAQKALPLTLEQLMQMVVYLHARNTLADLRDSALLQVGFFGAFRRSELVALRWENIGSPPIL